MTDPEQLALKWKALGFSCGLWIDPPGQVWENFIHDTDEIVCVASGKVEFEIGGKIRHPKAGEELLIPARVNHSVRNIGGTEARWYYGYKISS